MIDHTQLAQEFLKHLRGSRSQVAWSRRLGYRSNVAYPWESGRRFPTGAEAFRAIRRSGRDLDEGIAQFFGSRPSWLDVLEADSPEGVAQLMRDLKGRRSITDLAEATGVNRRSISRWLSGKAQPRLPDLFRYVDAASVRLVDFVEAFVDPSQLWSIEPLWRLIVARREGAGRHPWTQAILRVLEIESYKELPRHQPGWIARTLSIPLDTELECLGYLERSGQVRFTGTHYVQEVVPVDTLRTPAIGQQLKQHWAQLAADKIGEGWPGQFSYNVFAIGDEDFERIRALHLGYFRAMRSLVADATRGDRVAVVNVQLFALNPPDTR